MFLAFLACKPGPPWKGRLPGFWLPQSTVWRRSDAPGWNEENVHGRTRASMFFAVFDCIFTELCRSRCDEIQPEIGRAHV